MQIFFYFEAGGIDSNYYGLKGQGKKVSLQMIQ
jgi:hypothetical protein